MMNADQQHYFGNRVELHTSTSQALVVLPHETVDAMANLVEGGEIRLRKFSDNTLRVVE